MTMYAPLLLAFAIGFVAGLRTMTAPAAVSWGAWLGWLNLDGSPLSFMGSGLTATIFTTLAVVEYVTDLLPSTPNRTGVGPLFVRMLMGGLAGAGLSLSSGQGFIAGAVLGGVGAVVGAFAGYEIRKRLVSRLKVKDAFVAISEDLVAIVLAYWIVTSRL
jgi:uncharacterized membrane protein